MEVFGLDPIVAALLIAAIGTIYSVGLGYAKSQGNFDAKKMITSVLIAIPGSIILVATGIRSAETTDELMTLILLIGWILQISGTDTTIKSISAVIKNKIK